MGIGLFIDFGSTHTKVVAVDLAGEKVLAVAQAASTVKSNVMDGLGNALENLRAKLRYRDSEIELKLACSSAAGGLRMAAIGLVTELTAEAAKRAALGAGAKVLSVLSYGLSKTELGGLAQIAPDIILLAGGTDGGNKDALLQNARLLAASKLSAPIVVAGNKVVAEKAINILRRKGKTAILVENVMPELNRLNVEPAREAIREIFMRRIVEAKGLSEAAKFVGDIIMPTPMATLNAARLLADGAEGEAGLGELMMIEVGGATTNIHSVALGTPSQTGVVARGLPEPYAKRTVEGDLGLRINAASILELAGTGRVLANMPLHGNIEIDKAISKLTSDVSTVPRSDEEFSLDIALARLAVETAVERHAGRVEVVYTPSGATTLLTGKDLTQLKTLIGTGGVFSYGRDARKILEAALFREDCELSLRPKAPSLYVDRRYVFYAMGLLGSVFPAKAVRIMKANLEKL